MKQKKKFPACIKAWANEFGDHFSSPTLFQPKKEKVSYFPFGAPLTLCTFKFQNGNGHLIPNNSDSSSKRNQRHPKSK